VPEIDSVELRVTRFQRERTPELYNEIAREMLPLVRARATAIHARSGFASVDPRDDLIQFGSLGLLRAIESFDLSHNVKFATFAALRIEGAILDGLRSEDVLTRGERRIKRQLERAFDLLKGEGITHPSEEELQRQSGLSAEDFTRGRELMRRRCVVSIDGPRSRGRDESRESPGFGVGDLLPDGREFAVDRSLSEEDMWRVVRRCLPAHQAAIIEGIFRNGEESAKIAESLGVSRAWVSIEKKKALEDLRVLLEEGGPERSFSGSLRTVLLDRL
jgi:RNA polymerase sigma factor for flagellar operon FliA